MSTFRSLGLAAALALLFTAGAQAAPVNLIFNGGFETGNANGWVGAQAPNTNTDCNHNFNVGNSGYYSGCASGWGLLAPGFVSPDSGQYSAYATFDASPGNITRSLSQTFNVPTQPGTTVATWDDAIAFGTGWDFQPRIYKVDILNTSNQVVANLLTESFGHIPQGFFQNWTTHSVDITSILATMGGLATIRFSLFLPESGTGPGAFGLDQVAINFTAAVPAPAAGLLLLWGIAGIGVLRRRAK